MQKNANGLTKPAPNLDGFCQAKQLANHLDKHLALSNKWDLHGEDFNSIFKIFVFYSFNSHHHSFYVKQCENIFGDGFSLNSLKERVAQVNRAYGGYNYQGSNVVFVNGDSDPWYGCWDF
jgi:hypothetical protein